MRKPILASSNPRQLVDTVEGRHFITFGQGRIVEHGIHEIIHGAFQDHHGLADVQQLAGALADDVYAQQFPRFSMEDQLEPASGIAANLAARGLAIIGQAHFVRRVFFGQLFFGLTDERNLGDSVNAVGVGGAVGFDLEPESAQPAPRPRRSHLSECPWHIPWCRHPESSGPRLDRGSARRVSAEPRWCLQSDCLWKAGTSWPGCGACGPSKGARLWWTWIRHQAPRSLPPHLPA